MIVEAATAAGIAVLLAAALTLLLRRPRLAIDASLRGSTRKGTLYVVAHNRGRTSARGVRVQVWWRREDGTRAPAAARELGRLAPGDAQRLDLTDLHAGIASDAGGWSELVVRIVASNAFSASRALPLATRAGADEPVPAVEYRRADRCPGTPDGAHRWDVRPLWHDGVTERWHVCARCGFLQRLPLSPEEEATQARVRRERAARERQRMEEEFARKEAEARARARARPRAGGERARAPPPPDTDPFTPAEAYRVLGLAEGAAWADVLAAHRRLALQFHPDRAPGADPALRAQLEERMRDVNRARDRLREHLRA